jgi:hypothetical protein
MQTSHHRQFAAISLLGTVALLLAGCGNTLFYGEKTAFSMAIHLNDNPQTPVEVNMGLKRHVGEIAPPVASEEQAGNDLAVGEAVSSLSGFRLRYEENQDNILLGDLYIRTQFASGIAATILAEKPAQAIEVVRADFERSPDFVALHVQTRVDRIRGAIEGLGTEPTFNLLCDPAITHSETAEITAARETVCQQRDNPTAAKNLLLMQAFLDERTEQRLTAWETALGLTQQQ